MAWRKAVYSVIALYILLTVVVVALVKARGTLDPLSWPTIVVNIGLGAVILCVGLDALLFAQGFLKWMQRWRPLRNYSPHPLLVRSCGALFVAAGSLLLGENLLNALSMTGIIDYAPAY
jgi:hypothetical protein